MMEEWEQGYILIHFAGLARWESLGMGLDSWENKSGKGEVEVVDEWSHILRPS